MSIRINVDPTNPGQFFACCGLLELADRLWGGAEGWFEEDGLHFGLRPFDPQSMADCNAAAFMDAFLRCHLTNTMTASELRRREELSTLPRAQIASDSVLKAEKDALDTLWREAPIVFHKPFVLRLDWFADERAGGATFKTWAGQQSVVDIALGMKRAVDALDWGTIPSLDWLRQRTQSDSLPFYFDSDIGNVGSDRDVGFSFDPLKIRVQTRPLAELLAFVGVQRFRCMPMQLRNRYRYSLWFDPLSPEVAAPAACGLVQSPRSRAFQFRLLYRTKYLKSFLPATLLKGVDHEQFVGAI